MAPLSPIYPDETWQQYATPEDAGFSSEKLAKAEAYYHTIDSSGTLIVHNGVIVAGWGEIGRRFSCHSIRKSLMSALIAIYAEEGVIDPNATLDKLGINDDPPLNDLEKQACLIHLLKSQSGVYHPAAYEDARQKNERPERNSHAPGTHYWYNNWDFNTLCTIFEQETGLKFFEAFKDRIADPLQMEDFRLIDGAYHMEPDRSRHPAYLFRMSARDLARVGLLYQRKGKWKDRQIVPADWVEDSIKPYSGGRRWEFGLCWNVYGPDSAGGWLHDLGAFVSSGTGHNMIVVFPKANVIIINRANTYQHQETAAEDVYHMWEMVLDAQEGSPVLRPELHPYMAPPPNYKPVDLDTRILDNYVGCYHLEGPPPLQLDIHRKQNRLFCELQSPRRTDRVWLIPQSETSFIWEDTEFPITFELDRKGKPTDVTLKLASDRVFQGKRVHIDELTN